MLRPLPGTVGLPVESLWDWDRPLPQELPALRQRRPLGRRIQPLGPHHLQARRGHMQPPPLQKLCHP